MSTSTDPRTRTRNPRNQGGRLRDEILEAAREVLAKGGGEALTLRSVARQAGIAAPSIYRHFANRDSIMLTLVAEAFDELEAELRTAALSSSRPVERLRAVCSGYLRFAHDHPQRYRLLFGGMWDASAAQLENTGRTEAGQLGLGALSVLTDCVRACQEAGAAASRPPHDVATATWVALHGLAELRRTTPLFPWPGHIEEDLVRINAGLL